jgi:hypothetical protein
VYKQNEKKKLEKFLSIYIAPAGKVSLPGTGDECLEMLFKSISPPPFNTALGILEWFIRFSRDCLERRAACWIILSGMMILLGI